MRPSISYCVCVRTERLDLRELAERDLTALFEVHRDPAAFALDGAEPLVVADQAIDLFHRWRSHWDAHGFGYRPLVLRVPVAGLPAGETVGFAGVKHSELEGEPCLNLYYRLMPAAWGQGLGTEAVHEVLRTDAAPLPLRIVALISPQNGASQRLAQRAGLHRTGLRHEDDLLVYTAEPAEFA